jgi:hypothetical protein
MMKRNLGAKASALLAGLYVSVSPVALPGLGNVALAQQTTTTVVAGRVVDAKGAAVAGAAVSLKSSSLGISRSAETDAGGNYRFTLLPFGEYEVIAKATGFAEPKGRSVRAAIGGAEVDFQLAAAGTKPVTEEVTVVGTTQKRSAAFDRTTSGIAVDVAELSTRVPLGRDINNIMLLSPGATAADTRITDRSERTLISLSGTSVAENVYLVNGLNVTDPRNFLGGAIPPFSFIDTIEVKNGGYAAEFGRTTGGAVVTSTKHGTNDYHFGTEWYFTPDSMTSRAGNTFSSTTVAYGGTRKTDTTDGTIWASGPVVKDRLFLYGLYNYRNTDTTFAATSDGNQIIRTQDSPFWGVKLDGNLTASGSQRLEYTIFSDDQTLHDQPYAYSLTTGRGASQPYSDQLAGGVNHIGKYTGTFTDWFSLSALYGRYEQNQTDAGPSNTISLIQDRRPASLAPGQTQVLLGQNTTNAGPVEADGRDIREQFRIDGDFYFNALVDHHVRVGWDKENITSTSRSEYTGGQYWRYRTFAAGRNEFLDDGTRIPVTGDYALRTVYQAGGTVKAENTALYIQDAFNFWQDRIGVQVGVRYDQFLNKNAAGQTFIDLKDQFAPRFGLTFDPTGDRIHQFTAFYGNYYLPLAQNLSFRAGSANPFYREYYRLNGLNSNGTPILGSKIGQITFSSAATPNPLSVVSRSLDPMFDEEIILGYSYAPSSGFGAGWTFSVNGTKRNLKSGIEDTDLGPGVAAYCARNKLSGPGCEGNYDGVYGLINPGKPATFMLDLAGNGKLQTVNLTVQDLQQPKMSRDNSFVELTATRPFDGKWSASVSYVWSRSWGNYEGAVKSDIAQTDVSITQDFDSPGIMDNANGPLPNNRTHSIKVFGSYAITDSLHIGGNLLVQSPRQFGCLGFNGNAGTTPSYWACQKTNDGDSIATPRGSSAESSWNTKLDLQFAYEIPKTLIPGASVVRVDIFNVFNQKATLRRQEYGETSAGVVSPYYLKTATRQAPRSVRMGFSYQY